MLRPTISGLLRRDFPYWGLATLMAVAFVVGMIVPHKNEGPYSLVGLALFFLAGVVGFFRATRSYIATDGTELRSRCVYYSALRCQVSDIKRLYLSNATVVFGMTRPWMLWVDLPSGRRRYLSEDVKRFRWLDVFRLANALNRGCDGPAMPYLAFVACGSQRRPDERGTLSAGGSWATIQRLGREGATGKLTLRGTAGERWIYLIRGRYLRLEDSWPADVSPDMVSPADQEYDFQRSALSKEEVSMILRTLEDKWLGAAPAQGLDRADASS